MRNDADWPAPPANGGRFEVQLITALEECEFTGAPPHGLIYEPAPGAMIDASKLARLFRALAQVADGRAFGA